MSDIYSTTSEPPAAPPSLPPASPPKTDPFNAIDPKLQQDLTDVIRTGIKTQEGIRQQQEAEQKFDRARALAAFNAESVGPDMLPPKWDAAAEGKKHEYDPVEAFGSIGSIIGLMASAFVHAPLSSAFEASASAMNAIKEGKKDEYNRAYQAWKDNTELVIKRQNMQHQLYGDAMKLYETDMHAGDAKMRAAAAQMGDQKMLTMIEHGMIPELFEMQQKRAEANLKFEKAKMEMEQDHAKLEAYFEVRDAREALQKATKSGDPAAIEQANQKIESALQHQRDVVESFEKGGLYHSMSADTALRRQDEIERANRAREGQGERRLDLTAERQKLEAEHRRNMDAIAARKGDQTDAVNAERERHDKAMEGLTEKRIDKAGTGAGSARNQTFNDLKKKYIDEGMSPADADKRAAKETSEAFQPSLTPTRRDDLVHLKDQYKYSTEIIDKELDVLKKYVGAAGLAGKLTRGSERIGNLLGSNETDRVQFYRDLAILKNAARRLLTGDHSRAFKDEAERINDIVAGTSMGDLTKNTIRALQDLKKLYAKMRGDVQTRLGETPAASTPAEPEKPVAKPKWQEGIRVGG